jgi:hypothetical protein
MRTAPLSLGVRNVAGVNARLPAPSGLEISVDTAIGGRNVCPPSTEALKYRRKALSPDASRVSFQLTARTPSLRRSPQELLHPGGLA